MPNPNPNPNQVTAQLMESDAALDLDFAVINEKGEPPSVELVWGHNTPSLAVGYYHHKRVHPAAIISRSDSVSVSGVCVRFGESGG